MWQTHDLRSKYTIKFNINSIQLYFSSQCVVAPIDEGITYAVIIFWALGLLATEENTIDGVTTINERSLKPGYAYVTPYVAKDLLRNKGRQCENAIQNLLGDKFTLAYLNENEAACDCFRIRKDGTVDLQARENQDWNNGWSDGYKTVNEKITILIENIVNDWKEDGGDIFKFNNYSL